jgi:NAD(P)H dehydrogenase (quinone)
MSNSDPILVTGAAGQLGGIGGRIVQHMCDAQVRVRALVRRDDERAEHLRCLGAEVVVADLTEPEQVVAALNGCKRVYFGMGVSPAYLEATLVIAAAAREIKDFEILVNMSQMTVSEIDLRHMTESPQQRLHWLCEQALNWSGLPVVNLRPTVFQQNFLFWSWAAESIAKSNTIRLPFGQGRSSPIAARDVAEVTVEILLHPGKYVGQEIELTGPRSADLQGLAQEYTAALGRPVRYENVPIDEWRDGELRQRGLPEHVRAHILTMAKLHAAGRYDRLTDSVAAILGRPATSLTETLVEEADRFKASMSPSSAMVFPPTT